MINTIDRTQKRKPLTIAAGALGELAQPNFCPRCFWIKLNYGQSFPFQIPMPAIFNSIDSYVKHVVHRYFEAERRLPPWFPHVDKVVSIPKVPYYTKFKVTDPATGVTLRGMPDDVFDLEDSTYYIVDYKTARLTETQNELFPKYEVQINAYAYIGRRTFYPRVSGLSLIYLDPDTNFDRNPDLLSRSHNGLMLGFTPKVKAVEVKPGGFIEELLLQVAEINKMEVLPEGVCGCENCCKLEELISVAVY